LAACLDAWIKGDAEAITALLSGSSDVAVLSNTLLPYVQNGQMRVLATLVGDFRSRPRRVAGDLATHRRGITLDVPCLSQRHEVLL